jgi:C4-dicarboxylate-specific signal transduction histidine kinase
VASSGDGGAAAAGSYPLTIDDVVLLNRSATVARLISGVTHDVNNALMVISGSVEMLDDLDLPPQAQAKIARIRMQNQRATLIINNLAAFARERAETTARVSLREVVERSAGLRAFAVGRANIQMAVELPERDTCPTTANAMDLQQAILNVLVNAEQAVAGVPQAKIAVSLRDEGGSYAVVVTDNGPGVPGELRARIFEPFFTTREGAGAGLGLPAARSIALRSGGSLDLEESESGGASFVLRLPKV